MHGFAPLHDAVPFRVMDGVLGSALMPCERSVT